MKIPTLFSLAIIAACLHTCQKNNPPIVDIPVDPIDTIIPPPIDSHIIELGKVSVLKNGVLWDVPFNAWFSHSDSAFILTGMKMYSNGVLQSFSLDDIPCKQGRYSYEFWPSIAALYPNQIPSGSFGMLYDGDQPIGDFLLDTLRNDHFIEVLRYDTLTNIVEGRFQIYTKKLENSGWQPPGVVVPNSISMTEGKFRLEVKHY